MLMTIITSQIDELMDGWMDEWVKTYQKFLLVPSSSINPSICSGTVCFDTFLAGLIDFSLDNKFQLHFKTCKLLSFWFYCCLFVFFFQLELCVKSRD
jgi:hypothetical protein